jgi:hypothetical protein
MVDLDDGRWHPGIGDPSLLGWVTVAAYAMASWLALATWRLERQRGGSASHAFFWLAVGLLLLFLTFNKQLDLQSWFTEVMRDNAHENGWYEQRRELQRQFIVGLGAAACSAAAFGLYLLWPIEGPRVLSIGGLVLLAYFIVVRASSFHHIDVLLSETWLGMRFNGWMELGGIALVSAGAALTRRRLA